MDLDYFIKKDQIIKLKSTEKQNVLRELIEKLAELELLDNKERYYAQVIHRESLENTALGNGFAIPHTRTESVDRFISILGIHEDGVDYSSDDITPVNFILLSIFPSKMSTTYLYFIGMMARIFSNNEKKHHLEDARTPAKIHAVLKKEAESYFDSISDLEIIPVDTPDSLASVPSSDVDLLIRLDRLYKMFDSGDKSDKLKKKIINIKKLIDNRSLTYYERMRKKRSNPFSIVEKDSCSGCHMDIPPVYLKQIKDQDGISLCTHCGRFLIIV